jgi:hypothetical protein
MLYSYYSVIIAGALFLGMLLLIEVGRRIGRRWAPDDTPRTRAGLNAIDAAILSLLGLLIAFTFSGASDRFDARRHLIISEANAIGTAWLRIDLLPPTAQPDVREGFRQYVDARLSVVRQPADVEATAGALRRCSEVQNAIWTRSVVACRESGSLEAPLLLLPALTDMFSIGADRTARSRVHSPLVILVMLFLLALATSVLAGYEIAGGRRRSWIHIVGFAAAVAVVTFVIIDLEYPRLGLIRVDVMDEVFEELRQSMRATS